MSDGGHTPSYRLAIYLKSGPSLDPVLITIHYLSDKLSMDIRVHYHHHYIILNISLSIQNTYCFNFFWTSPKLRFSTVPPV